MFSNRVDNLLGRLRKRACKHEDCQHYSTKIKGSTGIENHGWLLLFLLQFRLPGRIAVS